MAAPRQPLQPDGGTRRTATASEALFCLRRRDSGGGIWDVWSLPDTDTQTHTHTHAATRKWSPGCLQPRLTSRLTASQDVWVGTVRTPSDGCAR